MRNTNAIQNSLQKDSVPKKLAPLPMAVSKNKIVQNKSAMNSSLLTHIRHSSGENKFQNSTDKPIIKPMERINSQPTCINEKLFKYGKCKLTQMSKHKAKKRMTLAARRDSIFPRISCFIRERALIHKGKSRTQHIPGEHRRIKESK